MCWDGRVLGCDLIPLLTLLRLRLWFLPSMDGEAIWYAVLEGWRGGGAHVGGFFWACAVTTGEGVNVAAGSRSAGRLFCLGARLEWASRGASGFGMLFFAGSLTIYPPLAGLAGWGVREGLICVGGTSWTLEGRYMHDGPFSEGRSVR